MKYFYWAGCVMFAALSAPIALTVSVAPALAQPGTDVTGRNVESVHTANAVFRKQADGSWAELDSNQRVIFKFQETSRDDWSVYLHDASRDLQLQLDLFRKKVSFGTENKARSDLYDIVAAYRSEPQAASPNKSNIRGMNVNFVHTQYALFSKYSDGRWIEMDPGQRIRFYFTETRRDESSVYLHDASRDVQIRLDLNRLKVSFGTQGGAHKDLYDIVDAATVAIPPKSAGNSSPQGSVSPQASQVRNVNAGPIWDQRDAELKCPVVGHAVNGRWTGGWRTTVAGQMSVCEISY